MILNIDKIGVGHLQVKNMETLNGIMSLCPFVCGICDAKFDSIAIYFSHIQKHNIMNKYIHCCFESSSKLSDDNNVYSCGKCQFKFPSVCTLYKHLLEDEAMTEFVFRNDDKTAYEFNVQNKCSDLKDHSAADDDEEDYDVDLNLHNDTGTLTNHSERLFVEVEKNMRPGITENSMRNKRLKSEFDRTAASIVNTEPCSATNGEPDLMNASLDDFADKIEETCSVSHVVNPNSKVSFLFANKK